MKRLKRQMSVNETKRLSFNAETKAQRLTASGYRTGTQLHVVSVLNHSHFQGASWVFSRRARLNANMLSHGCVCVLSCTVTQPVNTTHEL